MKIILEISKIRGSAYGFMRNLGYYYQGREEKTGQEVFARRLSASDYPRFHAYLKAEGEEIVINLHLDQKKPIYKGAPAHAGEYTGEVVEKEAERIKQFCEGR